MGHPALLAQIPLRRDEVCVGFLDDLEHMFHGFDNISIERLSIQPVGPSIPENVVADTTAHGGSFAGHPLNMSCIDVTLATFHALKSALNLSAPRNMRLMAVTFATSCRRLWQRSTR